MQDSETPTPSVMSNDPGGKTNRFKTLFSKRWVLVALAVFVLAGIGSALYMHMNMAKDAVKPVPTKPPLQKAKADNPLKPVDVTYEQLTAEQLLNKVNFLMGTKQYAEAEKLVRMQDDLSTNSTKQTVLLMVLNQQGKKTEAADEAAKMATAQNLTPGQIRLIGEQYEQAGNKAKAIEYYKKALDAYNTRKQGNDGDEAARIAAKIKELQ